MAFFRVTLIRSAIGLPAKYAKTLRALGLKKRMATVFHPVNPTIAGHIMRVKELIAVSEVDEALTKAQVKDERIPRTGYSVESRGVASSLGLGRRREILGSVHSRLGNQTTSIGTADARRTEEEAIQELRERHPVEVDSMTHLKNRT